MGWLSGAVSNFGRIITRTDKVEPSGAGRRAFVIAFGVSLFLPGLGHAQQSTSMPNQNFFTSELDVGIGSVDVGATVDDFLGQLSPGVWSQDTDIPGAWIYRITKGDQVTGLTHVAVLLFQPDVNHQNTMKLSRVVFDQTELAPETIAQNFAAQINAAAANPAALPIGNQPPPNFPVTTRFGVLSVNPSGNKLLLNGQSVLPSVQGNTSLDYVRMVQYQDTDMVIAQDTGGTACSNMYYVITLSASGATAIGTVGNCQAASAIHFNGPEVELKAGDDDFSVDGSLIEKNGQPIKPESPF